MRPRQHMQRAWGKGRKEAGAEWALLSTFGERTEGCQPPRPPFPEEVLASAPCSKGPFSSGVGRAVVDVCGQRVTVEAGRNG